MEIRIGKDNFDCVSAFSSEEKALSSIQTHFTVITNTIQLLYTCFYKQLKKYNSTITYLERNRN